MANSQNNRFLQQFQGASINRKIIFSLLIFGALLFFEIFNFGTTNFALRDLMGELKFSGIRWSTALSIAFCAIDFAGIARLFTPETGADEPKEIWYLFGAWLLAATMNAGLTWWGVSMALVNHSVASAAIVDPQIILRIVPVFVAILVWVIRVLVIGTLSSAEENLFKTAQPARANKTTFQTASPRTAYKPQSAYQSSRNSRLERSPVSARPARSDSSYHMSSRPSPKTSLEPTYHSINGSVEAHEYSEQGQNTGKSSSSNSGGRSFY